MNALARQKDGVRHTQQNEGTGILPRRRSDGEAMASADLSDDDNTLNSAFRKLSLTKSAPSKNDLDNQSSLRNRRPAKPSTSSKQDASVQEFLEAQKALSLASNAYEDANHARAHSSTHGEVSQEQFERLADRLRQAQQRYDRALAALREADRNRVKELRNSVIEARRRFDQANTAFQLNPGNFPLRVAREQALVVWHELYEQLRAFK